MPYMQTPLMRQNMSDLGIHGNGSQLPKRYFWKKHHNTPKRTVLVL